MRLMVSFITKKASDTQGLSITAGGGSFERGFLGARYGGVIGNNTSYRLYAKGFARNGLRSAEGKNTNSEWHDARGGFRLDHEQDIDQFTVQGDFYYRSFGDTLDKSKLAAPLIQIETDRGSDKGGNIRLRWERTLSDQSIFIFQTYYDQVEYGLKTSVPFGAHSFDIDANHSFVFRDRHRITWGANYRLYHNKVFGSELATFSPRARTNHQADLYIRDDISLIPDRLNLIIGSRFDHNDYTGFEIEPNIRLIWTPDQKNSIWGLYRVLSAHHHVQKTILKYIYKHRTRLHFHQRGYRSQLWCNITGVLVLNQKNYWHLSWAIATAFLSRPV